MTYYQITSEERYTIAARRREGFCSAEIAQRLGRHRSTISREVRRNSSRSDGCYRPSKAIERTNGRRSRSRRNQYFTKADFALVEKKLKADWSPEQISGHLRLHGKLSISHETIYTHVWRDKEAGGHLYRHLRCSPKLRRKRHNSYDSRGRLAGKRHISERPSCIEKRSAVGHWEIDTVIGKIVALIGKLSDRSMFGTSQRTKMLLRRVPDQVKTITATTARSSTTTNPSRKRPGRLRTNGVKFYFATPYHSWERGSNENFNVLRRPAEAQRKATAIVSQTSTRPRKRLGYRTNVSMGSNDVRFKLEARHGNGGSAGAASSR